MNMASEADIPLKRSKFVLFVLGMFVSFGICLGEYFLYSNDYLTILYSLNYLMIIVFLFLLKSVTSFVNFVKIFFICFFLFLLNRLYRWDVSIYNLSETYHVIDFILFSWTNNIAFIGVFYYAYQILVRNPQRAKHLFSKRIYFFITVGSLLIGCVLYVINPLSYLLPYKEIVLFTLVLAIIMACSFPKEICMWFCAGSYLSFVFSFIFVVLLIITSGVSHNTHFVGGILRNTPHVEKFYFNTNFSYLAIFQVLTFMPLIFVVIPEKKYPKHIKILGAFLVFILLTCGLLTRYYSAFEDYYSNFSRY